MPSTCHLLCICSRFVSHFSFFLFLFVCFCVFFLLNMCNLLSYFHLDSNILFLLLFLPVALSPHCRSRSDLDFLLFPLVSVKCLGVTFLCAPSGRNHSTLAVLHRQPYLVVPHLVTPQFPRLNFNHFSVICMINSKP